MNTGRKDKGLKNIFSIETALKYRPQLMGCTSLVSAAFIGAGLVDMQLCLVENFTVFSMYSFTESLMTL